MSKRGRIENLKPIQKGEVRNPTGRPKTKHITDQIQELLLEPIQDGSKMTIQQALLKRLVKDALSGKPYAFKELHDRGWGKALQSVEVTGVIDSTNIELKASTPEEAAKVYQRIMKAKAGV